MFVLLQIANDLFTWILWQLFKLLVWLLVVLLIALILLLCHGCVKLVRHYLPSSDHKRERPDVVSGKVRRPQSPTVPSHAQVDSGQKIVIKHERNSRAQRPFLQKDENTQAESLPKQQGAITTANDLLSKTSAVSNAGLSSNQNNVLTDHEPKTSSFTVAVAGSVTPVSSKNSTPTCTMDSLIQTVVISSRSAETPGKLKSVQALAVTPNMMADNETGKPVENLAGTQRNQPVVTVPAAASGTIVTSQQSKVNGSKPIGTVAEVASRISSSPSSAVALDFLRETVSTECNC
jgi:hypothetical protein